MFSASRLFSPRITAVTRERRFVLVLLSGLLLAACGGGNGADDAEGARLTKTEFTRQANELCRAQRDRLETELAAKFPDGADPPNDEELAAVFVDLAIPDYEATFDEISALRPPEGMADAVEQAIVATQASIETFRMDPIRYLNSDDDPFIASDELLTNIGLNVCAD